MSNRKGFIFAFSGLLALALGAASAHADDRYRKTNGGYGDDRNDDRMYKDGVYADDDYQYGDQARVTNNRFRGMDRNHDGVISRYEWRGDERSFRNQDWNDDGVLSGREVRANAARTRNRDSRVDAEDRNRDGVIDRGEWMGNRGEFNRLDRNRDGVITSAEARRRYSY